ncbi:hypothetical protein F5879DRAFT_1074098 [Lentinula edodes]|nr:hypothetical protein F5879DRAFT_1074098 [Lentinula edodes]
MASLAPGSSNLNHLNSQPQPEPATKVRRNSLTRNDSSVTMNRMVLGSRAADVDVLTPEEHGRMKTCLWMDKLHEIELDQTELRRSLLSICLPSRQSLTIFQLAPNAEHRIEITALREIPAISTAIICGTRWSIWDLLVVKPGGGLSLLTHGTYEVALTPTLHDSELPSDDSMDVEDSLHPRSDNPRIISVIGELSSPLLVTFQMSNESITCTAFHFYPSDDLTLQALQTLALCLPSDMPCIRRLAFKVAPLYLPNALYHSGSHKRFREDPAIKNLKPPVSPALHAAPFSVHLHTMEKGTDSYNQLVVVLYTLHTLAEGMRLLVDRYPLLMRLAPVICRIAMYIRPEWADYWRRMCPDAMFSLPWPSSATAAVQSLDDTIPVWPPDISAILYGRISSPEWKNEEFIARLPLGIAAPLREAIRTCQLAPPLDWPQEAYKAISRDDVAASANPSPDMMLTNGYRSAKEYLTSSRPRKTIGQITSQAKAASLGESEATTGVELELDEFTNIRFGQDRRLEEIARLLSSSTVSSARSLERFAMQEAFTIPKFEFTVKLHPMNGIVSPDTGKLMPDSVGVNSVMVSLRRSEYLLRRRAWTHDLTSTGVLLGLSAANAGNGNQHVTKLLSVHTPALLPTPTVDLNVLLHTQAAGMSGVGLLYMGSMNRRMAEVCLNQMNRKDLVQPDLSNEYCETYTYSAALAFGMVMLGKGTAIRADIALLERLNLLIHGDGKFGSPHASFDISLTSPAASIPDTILWLNRVQPSFLLIRTSARSLIMWRSSLGLLARKRIR